MLRRPIVSVFLVCFLVACQRDRQESFYSNLAAAHKDGAVTRGWIPSNLPTSSRDIREVHNLSPSTEWCSFEFSVADAEAFRTSLKNANMATLQLPRVPSPRVSWWPAMMTGTLDVKRIHDDGFDLYRGEAPETSVTTEVSLFAVDWSNGTAYFYTAPKGD
jgi:hypothetical protein